MHARTSSRQPADRTAARGIDALMRAYRGARPGAAVLVVVNGSPVFRRAYGCADLEARTRTTPATNYRLASITKQFTAAAVLLLVQSDLLTLDDLVDRWLPSLPDAVRRVTIRQLLTHTSGVPDYEDLLPVDTVTQTHDSDVLQLLRSTQGTYFAPGTAYRYSNTGYVLLALIVAAASGRDFATFLRERIFRPLGMHATVAYEAGISTVAHRAYGYSAVQHTWTRTDQSVTSAMLGDGGIYSSIDDLGKWDAALEECRLLRPDLQRLAFTAATPTDDPAVQYGFGWRITGETRWHSGESVGFRNVIVRYPARRFTVIVLTNRDDPEPYPLALQIAEIFFPDANSLRAARSAAGPDPHARLGAAAPHAPETSLLVNATAKNHTP